MYKRTVHWRKKRLICHRENARATAVALFLICIQETAQIPAAAADKSRQRQDGSRQSFPNKRVYQPRENTIASTIKVPPRHRQTSLWGVV